MMDILTRLRLPFFEEEQQRMMLEHAEEKSMEIGASAGVKNEDSDMTDEDKKAFFHYSNSIDPEQDKFWNLKGATPDLSAVRNLPGHRY